MKKQLKINKIKIINFLITPIKIDKLILEIYKLIKNKKKAHYICVSSVHGATESFLNNSFKKAHNNADIALPDGRPIYWALKFFCKNETDHLPGYFVTDKICDLANKKNLSLGIYGSTDIVQKKFITKIKKKYKKIKFKYLYSPPFRKISNIEKNKICNSINKSKIDILFVALGAPKQEIWINEASKSINAPILGVGAAFDFYARNVERAPLFMRQNGLEWLYRIYKEPRRLFFRYFFSIILFFIGLTIQLVFDFFIGYNINNI